MQLIRRQIVCACAGTGKIKDGDGSDTQETPRLEKFDRHCPRRRIFATRINQCSPWSPDYGNRNIWWSTWHVTQVRSVRMQKYQKPNTRGTCHNISWKAIGSFCVSCVLFSFIHVWDVIFSVHWMGLAGQLRKIIVRVHEACQCPHTPYEYLAAGAGLLHIICNKPAANMTFEWMTCELQFLTW